MKKEEWVGMCNPMKKTFQGGNMAVFKRNLQDTNDIFEEVSNLCKDESLGNKVTIARMYGDANRYKTTQEKKCFFSEKARCKYLEDVILVGDDSAIIVAKNNVNSEEYYQPITVDKVSSDIYWTLDQALIGLICLRTNNEDAYKWIAKMIGIYGDE
mgnify:CR=1 FL=1